jgi:hypothetical protein
VKTDGGAGKFPGIRKKRGVNLRFSLENVYALPNTAQIEQGC